MTAEGDVTRADVDALLLAIEAADAVRYGKLFDATQATTSMDGEELLAIGVRIRGLQKGPVGALAFVVQKHRRERLARILGILASARRPMRLFTEARTARQWLYEQLPPTDKPET